MIDTVTVEMLMEADAKCQEIGRLYQVCVYQERLFSERSKDLLAALKLEILKENLELSDVRLETMARGRDEYKEFRKEQIRALQEAGKREIQYKDAVRHWESIQSCLSYRRAEIQRFAA